MGNECLDTIEQVVRIDVNLVQCCELPQAIMGLQPGDSVLDLGSGDGAYGFLAATAVGESGAVIGVDTTPDMIGQARANVIRNGLCNVSFRLGELEYLPVADQSIDVIISHYGINQSSAKTQVFREAFRTLKPGGRVALVEMVAMQPLPEDVEEGDVLYTECLSGVVMLDDLEDMLRAVGFEKIRSETQQSRHERPLAWRTSMALKNVVAPAMIEAVKPT